MMSTCWSSTTANPWTKALPSASPAAPPRSSSPWRRRRRGSWRGSSTTWSRRTCEWQDRVTFPHSCVFITSHVTDPPADLSTGSCSRSTTVWRRPTTGRACPRCRRPRKWCRRRRRAPATPSSSQRPNCCVSTKDAWRPACRSWRITTNSWSHNYTASGSCWSRYTHTHTYTTGAGSYTGTQHGELTNWSTRLCNNVFKMPENVIKSSDVITWPIMQ